MHKIFKYPFDKETRIVTMPRNGKIIRIDYVDDGFYKGDFVWAIVNTADEKETFAIDPLLFSNLYRHNSKDFYSGKYPRHELKVKEKQTVFLPSPPIGAHEDDGKIYVVSEPYSELKLKGYKIGVFKTGQPIDVDIDKLTYLGLNRLWIVQELGLYTFLIHD